jgi:4'-phosphopantetheinyl transferase
MAADACDVHVSCVCFQRDASENLRSLEAALPQVQRERAARFRSADDRLAYVAAHRLEQVSLARGGRPAVETPEQAADMPAFPQDQRSRCLGSNLTHTQGLAAHAWSLQASVGIDAEWLDHSADNSRVTRTFLAPSEQAAVAQGREDERRSLFLRFWTLKEAVAKALGQGLALPFAGIVFSLEPLALRALPQGCGLLDEWQIAELAVGPAHHLSIAVRRPPGLPVRLHSSVLTLDQLT